MIFWYKKAFQNAFDFTGRARRKEYWYFQLGNVLISLLILVPWIMVFDAGEFMMIPVFMFSFAVMIPSWSLTVRRLHDIGKSGWWILAGLIPFGSLVLFVFSLLDSQVGDNIYGPNPKGITGTSLPKAILQ